MVRSTVVAALVAAPVAALVAMGCGPGDDGRASLSSPESTSAAGWERLAPPPLSPRANAVGVWTGDEVLVVGGEARPWCPTGADCMGPDEPALADGAGFDPATGSWRPIAEAPVPVIDADTAVAGGAVYLWVPGSPRPGGRAAFLRYDPAADVWSELPLPVDDPSWYQIEPAPGGVVVYPGSDEAGGERPDMFFDPRTGHWRELPADPLSPSFDRTLVGTDRGLVLFGRELVPQPGSDRPAVARAAVLDVASGEWERLPDSEILSTGPWHVEGDLLVNPSPGSADGGAVGGWGRSYPDGGMFDVTSRRWAPLPDRPGAEPAGGPTAGVIGARSALYIGHSGAVLDLAGEEWIEIPTLDEPEGTDGRTVVTAGTSLFVFGGQVWPPDRPDGHTIDDAWLWTPRR